MCGRRQDQGGTNLAQTKHNRLSCPRCKHTVVLCHGVPCCAVLIVVLLLSCVHTQEWVERYKTNRAAAAAELMTLLVKVGVCVCSNCAVAALV